MAGDHRKAELDNVRTAAEWLASQELKPLITRIVRSHGLTSQDADDVLQETLISLLRAGLHVRASRAWICAVAARRSIDANRRRTSRLERERAYSRIRTPSETGDLLHLLYARVAGLPQREQAVFELHYRQGLTEREVAAKLGISRASVRRLDDLCRNSLTK